MKTFLRSLRSPLKRLSRLVVGPLRRIFRPGSMNAVGATSRWIAAARAIESARPDALFHDPLAAALAGDADPHGRAYTTYLSIRTRFFDDALFAAVGGQSLTQVVLLGAGMDSRAFRFDWNPELKWFEVDRAEVLWAKKTILDSQRAVSRCKRIVVPVNLAGKWTARLTQAGFDSQRPAAFLLEGLLIYFKRPAAESLLKSLDKVAAAGSWFGCDMASADFLADPARQSQLDRMRKEGSAWHLGVNDAPAFIERFGWRAQYTLPGEPAANFGRWSEPIPDRNNRAAPQRSFLITAQR